MSTTLTLTKEANGIRIKASRDYCYDMLNKVSRSFALVIQQLPESQKDAICIFYLVLRGLDTIEDDTSIPLNKKKLLLDDFCENLGNTYWHLDNIGDKPEYVALLENFYHVNRIYNELSIIEQATIKQKCVIMKHGMLKYVNTEVNTIDDYNDYCYYVAGLVGEGLSELFENSGFEKGLSTDNNFLSVSMGLFLQKTNIIRDFHEDALENRFFWPKEIWSSYTDNLKKFMIKDEVNTAVECLNALVIDAITHIPDCINYLENIKNKKIRRFCAIPQVMAIGTLSVVFNNPKVFSKNVKLNKLTALQIIQEIDDLESIKKWFLKFLTSMEKNCLGNSKELIQAIKIQL